jgi:predicted DNA-binding protein YlxM (UPF0122 family)
MARDSVNKEQWVIVRKLWEADPLVSYQEIAEQLGVTRQCVRQKSVREGWVKQMTPEELEAAAHRASQAKFTEKTVDKVAKTDYVHVDPPATSVPRAEFTRVAVAVEEGSTPEQVGELAQRAAVDQRKKLLDHHKEELKAARAQIYAAIKAAGSKDGYTRAKTAKTIVESFKVLHEIERRAWGMDVGEGGGKPAAPPVTIVAHMQQGVKIG